MRTIEGERVEVITNEEYNRRFPDKELCEKCPEYNFDTCFSCGIGMHGKVYVKIENRLVWR